MNKVVMQDTTGVSSPYPHADYNTTHAWLTRDDNGYDQEAAEATQGICEWDHAGKTIADHLCVTYDLCARSVGERTGTRPGRAHASVADMA